MGVTTNPPDARLLRFDALTRYVHWATATLFAVTVSTAAALYLPSLSVVVGRRALVRDVHVASGLSLLGLFVLTLAAPLRAEARALGRWSVGEGRWLLPRRRTVLPLAKFNPGQKLFAAFVGGVIPSMALTGSVMRWFDPFPLAWRTGSTLVHDWLGLAFVGAVAGHVSFALADPVALRGMVRGWVPASWARVNRPRWHDELTAAVPPWPQGPAGAACRRRWLAVSAALSLIAAVFALGHGDPHQRPAVVAVGYQEALVAGDTARLYDLSGPELRGGRPLETFVEETTRDLLPSVDERGSVIGMTAEHTSLSGDRARVVVRMDYMDGLSTTRDLRLRRSGGAWRVTGVAPPPGP